MDNVKGFFKKYGFLIFCIFFSLLLLSITIYRAFTIGITYDEAYTYLYYVRKFSWDSFSYFIRPGALANNHFLNTLSIAILDGVFNLPYNEFLIRLPNILSYVLYLFFAYKLSKKYESKYLIMSLFLFNYGAYEYFGFARGYGIAMAFVLGGIYFYKLWYENKEKLLNLTLSYVFLLIGCFANTVVLLILATILIDSFIRLIASKNLIKYFEKFWYLLIPIIFGILLNIKYHFLITAENLPLYGGEGSFFNDVIKSLFTVYGFKENFIIIFLATLLMIIFGFVKNYKTLIEKNLWIISIIYFLTLISITLITDQLWLTGRTLIPLFPLLILSFAEFYEKVFLKYPLKEIINLVIILTIVILFFHNLNIFATKGWYHNHGKIKEEVYNLFKEGKESQIDDLYRKYNNNPAVKFYEEKINKCGFN